jgi:hypothetical protein
MDTNFSALSHLSPEQHRALYEHAKHEAHALRRQALRDAAAWLADRVLALWQAARRAAVTPGPLAREV